MQNAATFTCEFTVNLMETPSGRFVNMGECVKSPTGKIAAVPMAYATKEAQEVVYRLRKAVKGQMPIRSVCFDMQESHTYSVTLTYDEMTAIAPYVR